MMHNYPVGELFPDDDLAPVSEESVRYVYQLRRVNRIVIGLRELDASLGKKIGVASGLIVPVNGKLEEVIRALERDTAARDAQNALHEELVARITSLEARLPDPTRVRHEILGDLWQMLEPLVLELNGKLAGDLEAHASEAASVLIEAATRGFAAPSRPEHGAPLTSRLRYRRDRLIYRTKKFAADWLAVFLVIGVLGLIAITISLFVLIAHGPL
jgi:hypothetical protein